MNKKEDIDFAELIISGAEDDCAFDQPCKHGHRVGGHSVYCHNKNWKNAPRKCHRSWFTGHYEKDDENSDYQCEGFELNTNYKLKVKK